MDPYRCVGLGAIKGQCQRDHFYGMDGLTDNMLRETERQIAPVLYATNDTQAASTEQWQALRLLAVQLHLRTNKAAELAKIPPRFAADQVITGRNRAPQALPFTSKNLAACYPKNECPDELYPSCRSGYVRR